MSKANLPALQDPLSEPARANAFRFLSSLRRPAGIDEIAEALGLHHTGVRQHLRRLEHAGLVERRIIRVAGRGRPRYEWTVSPDAMPAGEPPRAYADLAGWLAGALAAGATTPEELELHGIAIGKRLAPERVRASAGGRLQALNDTFAAMGCAPRPQHQGETSADDTATFVLRSCPYRDAVRAPGGRAICSLHKGLACGLVKTIARGATMTNFVAKDPDEAGCLVEVAGLTGPA